MQQQQDSQTDREKILSENVNTFTEEEGEEFNVTVKKVSNGYIIECPAKPGSTLVFEDNKYPAAIKFIIDRRLKKMKPGEEIELCLTQRFTKIIKD